MKKILYKLLRLQARLTLWKYRPTVVAITGSVGKTTTKMAIAVILSARYRVRQSQKSYNNEVGVPLTIMGATSAGRSLTGWLEIFLSATKNLLFTDATYPEVLVLEFGADHPGDIQYLVHIARPTIAVLTAIAPAHLESFGTIEHIAKEKRQLVQSLSKGGCAILNRDDAMVMATKIPAGVKRLTYGFDAEADIHGSDTTVHFGKDRPTPGTSAKVTAEGSTVPIFLEEAIGYPALSSALGGITVGLALGVHLIEASEALRQLTPTSGRLRLLNGMQGSLIIDDTYNSSPRAVAAALDVLAKVPAPSGKRWVVLADMLELGPEAPGLHEEVGRIVAEKQIFTGLVTVGELARGIARTARLHGVDASKLYSFSRAEDAGEFLQRTLGSGDVVLIKGSQSMRMEKAVKMVMAEPEKAKEVLVRQDELWEKK